MMLRFLYNSIPGRILLKFLASRPISNICGAFLDTRLSAGLIPGFVRRNHIDLSEYTAGPYKSFNAFFTRQIRKGRRPIDSHPDHLISPCDGLLSVYQIADRLVLPVKQSHYTIDALLQNKKLAKKYQNGTCLVFRLCVDHYHRYCYLDDCNKGGNTFIPGKLHTVRPVALETLPVFTQNCREYTVMKTANFGTVTQIEVGAMLVGKIKNHHQSRRCLRGEEKGMFLYGGSTIIVLLEKDKAKIDACFLKASARGLESPVKMGEKLGTAIKNC